MSKVIVLKHRAKLALAFASAAESIEALHDAVNDDALLALQVAEELRDDPRTPKFLAEFAGGFIKGFKSARDGGQRTKKIWKDLEKELKDVAKE